MLLQGSETQLLLWIGSAIGILTTAFWIIHTRDISQITETLKSLSIDIKELSEFVYKNVREK
jgi:hypothetical protein